jgi:porphobilinogen synthase
MRRLRKTEEIRNILRETTLLSEDLIYPLFIKEGLINGEKERIKTMPGQFRYSLDDGVEEAKRLEKLGLKSVIIFGMPLEKDDTGSMAFHPEGIVQRTVKKLKMETDLVVITDVCLCQYTNHGHCGLVEEGHVLNDESLHYLAKTALSHAQSGADIVAPSDMMDGRVKAIRDALDNEGYQDTLIMSYAAKYASSFYAPFRDAVCSAPSFGDRRTYQMNPYNISEALMEVEMDLEEGADLIIVKPALAYLDIINRIKTEFRIPTAAYQVSGEYSMLMAGIEADYLTKDSIFESLVSIKRAGADLIITHFAPLFLEGKLQEKC